jgi:putative zinc finger/helix-turn-helix YgiT family protein
MARKFERSQCELCGSTMEVTKATSKRPYRYEMSGLDNIFLVGIEVRHCAKCDVRVPIIPKIEGLHKAIAKYLANKEELLSGKELKFLRKSAGIPAHQFAALLEIDAAHLSRVENEKTESFGAATDKLARAVAVAAADGEDVRNILLRIADQRIHEQRAVFSIKEDHWEKLAA